MSNTSPPNKPEETTKQSPDDIEKEIARLKAKLQEVKTEENKSAAGSEEAASSVADDSAGQEEPAEAASSAADDSAKQEAPAEGPTVLWEAPMLTKPYEQTESLLGVSALASASGLGMALLGVAPFTAPNPFMFALLLAVIQVRLSHIWGSRMLRAQTRRHVTQVVQTIESDVLLVAITCDGGLVRKLRLVAPAGNEKKPSFAEVIKEGKTYIFFDKEFGKGEQALEELLLSDRVIASEEFTVTPLGEEDQGEADKVVQRLSTLSREDLKKIQGKDAVAPKKSLAQLRRSAQMLGSVILTAGLILCLGGRYSAEAQLDQA